MGRFDGVLIVSDLDGTYFGDGGVSVRRNIDAVEYFKSCGGLFTFATGRLIYNVKKSIPDVDRVANLPVITCNGTCLYDYGAERVVKEYFLNGDDARDMISVILGRYADVAVRLSTRGGYAIPGKPNSYIMTDISKFPAGEVSYISVSEIPVTAAYKMTFRGESDTLDRIKDDIFSEFSGKFEVNKSSPTFLELQPRGHTKASMIAELADGIAKRRGRKPVVYAVGDYENDIEMLKNADIAVCPENAHESVKRICDLVLCDHSEGVIADLIYYRM